MNLWLPIALFLFLAILSLLLGYIFSGEDYLVHGIYAGVILTFALVGYYFYKQSNKSGVLFSILIFFCVFGALIVVDWVLRYTVEPLFNIPLVAMIAGMALGICLVIVILYAIRWYEERSSEGNKGRSSGDYERDEGGEGDDE